jgi:tRNA pseudouridine38/39 synthase
MWVRSNRKEGDGGPDLGDAWRPPTEEKPPKPAAEAEAQAEAEPEAEGSEAPKKKAKEPKPQPKAEPAEIAYPRLLNGVLPPSIRILAWSPVAADFNSRFSTEYRHYKYSFHQHAIHGRPPLDLQRMEEGAALLLGEHDFRNLCKLDGSKQIQNHSRRVIKAWFEPGPLPDQIVFNLIGTAFLWHQVRHIIAVLFLIGSGLEQPSLISDLLDVERFPGKPGYNMGHPLPLTLHHCEYKPGTLDWRFGPYDGPWGDLEGEARENARPMAEQGFDQFVRQLDSAKQEAEIRAWQVGGALRRVKDILGEPSRLEETNYAVTGAGESFHTKTWNPVTSRPQGDTPEDTNRKWREQKTRTGKLPAHIKADEE